MAVDSAAVATALRTIPFTSTVHEAFIRHCTFIARKAGALVASLTAVGSAEQSGYSGPYSGLEHFYMSPLVSISTKASIELSNIAFYEREGLQSTFPATVQGRTSSLRCTRSNLFKTATALRTGAVILDTPITTVDPLFIDSTWWFVQPSSPLATSDYNQYIGYDIHRLQEHTGPDDVLRPSVVKNITAKTVGLSTVLIRWSPLPAAESIATYTVYRAPGDPSYYYINQRSQWEFRVPAGSSPSVLDSFSTTASAYLDTTAVPGTPYLYVVSAVNNKGAGGEIALPSPPDIATYFVNTLPDRKSFKADEWQMAASAGGASLPLPADSRHSLFGWDDTRTPDKLFANYVKATSLVNTSGYWFKPASDTQLSFNKESLAALESVAPTTTIALKKGATGWNMVSSPFPFSVTPSWLSTFPAWEWNSDSLGYRKATALSPWKAYWMHTEKDTSLVIWKKQPLSYYLSSSLAKSATPAVLWQLNVALQSGKSFDTDNQIGAVAFALAKSTHLAQPEPPAAFDAARLFIVNTTAATLAADAKPLASLLKAVASDTKLLEWTIGIDAHKEPATLSVRDLPSLPDGWNLYWIDKDRQVALDYKNNSVEIPPSSSTTYGVLVATSDISLLGRYSYALSIGTITSATSYGPVIVSYTIPYTWNTNITNATGSALPVSLDLYDIAGRRVVSLLDDKKAPGRYRAIWNRQNSSGHQVATGVYFIRLHVAGQYKTARFINVQ